MYVLIPRGDGDNDSWPCDTAEEIGAAADALRAAGLDSAEVWVGEEPDAVRTGQIVWAP